MLTISLAHIKTREGPDPHLVYALQSPRPIKPGQGIAWCKLAPAYCQITVEGEQACRLTALNQFTKRCFIRRARPLAIVTADAPIHTPATVDNPLVAEEVFECRQPIECERVDAKLNRSLLVVNGLGDHRIHHSFLRRKNHCFIGTPSGFYAKDHFLECHSILEVIGNEQYVQVL